MEQHASADQQVDLDQMYKSQMEKAAPTYDVLMKRMTFGRERALREMTVDLAGVKPGDSVLEVGCGTGTLTLAAKRRAGPSGQVFGIDVIPVMIELSQQKAAQAGEEIPFQLASIEEIPFPANTFDVVMCSFMIFHMSEKVRRKGISEIYRVLKPQGRLLVVDSASPTKSLLKIFVKLISRGELPPDLRELLPLMQASGFSTLEIAPVNFKILGFSPLTFVRGSARKS
jgi:ubiquinone/menaquinone biosynthesis C-methylase UbiE